MRATAAAMVVVAGLSTAAAAEPKTLMLACDGTITAYADARQRPPTSVSRGVLINFADRTVKGFGKPTDRVKVHSVDETYISFGTEATKTGETSITGKLDRVTGELSAIMGYSNGLTNMYSLKCKPAQRMF